MRLKLFNLKTDSVDKLAFVSAFINIQRFHVKSPISILLNAPERKKNEIVSI